MSRRMPQSSSSLARPPSEAGGDGCPNPKPGATAPAVDVSGALLLVLGYLRLPELLVFQGVSRLFRDAVSRDSLLWRRVAIERPLSYRLTDEVLVRITSRAEGKLESLALLDCWYVTDHGLLQVVNRNRGITKLHVPGCTQLSADGVVRIIKWHYELKGRLESLQINGIPKLTIYHLDALKSLFETDVLQVSCPINYNNWHSSIFNSDRPIDVDICPKCSAVRVVFDCTRENCRSGKSQWRQCRGCFFCITRCEDCGGCFDLTELSEETVCSHYLCQTCWLRLPKCNLCNRPYCNRHSKNLEGYSKYLGFLCEQCMESTSSSD